MARQLSIIIGSGLSAVKNSRSILKRPPPLPLSPIPFPFFDSSVISGRSPHVHFAPSPTLVSMYPTHSPNTYDRTPMPVSPNPLEMPSWGDRIYSPSIGQFRIQSRPKVCSPKLETAMETSEFEEADSPKQQPRCRLVWKDKASALKLPSRKPKPLGLALTNYPRSPYPSAPMSSSGGGEVSGSESRVHSKYADKTSSIPTRTQSLDDGRRRRNATPGRSPAFPGLFSPRPSPLVQSLTSPGVEPAILGSANRSRDSSDTSSSSNLNQAFWQSISLQHQEDTASMTSAALFEEVTLTYAGRDGILWSPGRPTADLRTETTPPHGYLITSPPINHPISLLPSFSTALSADGRITYPQPVVLNGW